MRETVSHTSTESIEFIPYTIFLLCSWLCILCIIILDDNASRFAAFPEYKSNKFYITGESYAGIYIPMMVRIDEMYLKFIADVDTVVVDGPTQARCLERQN